MRIDFKELLSEIDLAKIPEGKFNLDIDLPDGRSANIQGRLEIKGYRVYSYHDPDDNGYFRGSIEFSLTDWTGYDPEGREIPIINSTWFENRVQSLINNNK